MTNLLKFSRSVVDLPLLELLELVCFTLTEDRPSAAEVMASLESMLQEMAGAEAGEGKVD
jgi:hypothetical protein